MNEDDAVIVALTDQMRVTYTLQVIHVAAEQLLNASATAALAANGDIDGDTAGAKQAVFVWTQRLMEAMNLYKSLMVDFLPDGKHTKTFMENPEP